MTATFNAARCCLLGIPQPDESGVSGVGMVQYGHGAIMFRSLTHSRYRALASSLGTPIICRIPQQELMGLSYKTIVEECFDGVC